MNPLDFPMCGVMPRRMTPVSTWGGHIPFAMTLVDAVRPRTFVELGSHFGDSYFAFCQTVAERGLDTKCHAVDTWQGDTQAGGYGEHVYHGVEEHNRLYYSSFSTLHRTTFDEAVGRFADSSIDLLHIDGLHTYEAVRHDYETWLPKVSPRGVVLFHDCAVMGADFGVWRFWNEVRGLFPSFEFLHSCGLGVLAVGPEIPDFVRELCSLPEDRAQKTRVFFERQGDLVGRTFPKRTGDISKAISALYGIPMDSEQNLLHCAIFHLVAGELETARASFSKILSFKPGNSAALAGCGAAMLMLGMRDEAHSRLAAAAANGDNGDILALCAIVAKDKGQADQAHETLLAGQKHFPANLEFCGVPQ